MENTYWSKYVQFTEELYFSRSLRFRDDNAKKWLELLQVNNNDKVLEVGCGGGLFCHRIKKHLPGTNVTGIDLDSGHIEYAKAKSKELNLDCSFIQADATALPFSDESFDVAFSYTVASFCEPNSYFGEQYRILKKGGRCLILFVVNHDKHMESWVPDDSCSEKGLFYKLWNEADKNELNNLKHYETEVDSYLKLFEKFSFHDIMLNTLSVVSYCPDSANISDELAIEQINTDRLHELCSVQKARNLAPDVMCNTEFDNLIEMINRRWDKHINDYKKGIKKWDWRISTVAAMSGVK